jgi:hypothetical protein
MGAINIATPRNISGSIDFSNRLKKYASLAVFATNPIATKKNEKRKKVNTIFPSPGLILTMFFMNFILKIF